MLSTIANYKSWLLMGLPVFYLFVTFFIVIVFVILVADLALMYLKDKE